MKFKSLILLVLTTLTLSICLSPAAFATSESQFTIDSTTAIINGTSVTMEVAPYIKDGRTFMPLAYVAQAIGVNNIKWDPGSQTVNMMNESNVVQIQIGSQVIMVGGGQGLMDVAPEINNGRTCLPIGPIAQAFGCTPSWDPATQTVTIITEVTTSGEISTTHAVKSTAKVHFIDVGQADSVYIQLPNNVDILIDGGNVGDGSTIVNYLKAQNVDDIELMIATHPHEDHIGGLPAILESFKVEEIIDSGKNATSKIYKTYAADAEAEGCPWEEDDYQTFDWGGTTFEVLTGDQKWSDVNDYSVVCLLDTGDVEFLFEGDAEAPAEAALCGDISTDFLKVGHHGSTSSTSPSFLSMVNPNVAVISVGTGNTYGHPAQSTLDKLQAAGASIYRTDLSGTIVVTLSLIHI